MARQIPCNATAGKSLIQGITVLTDTMQVTYGPLGRGVILEQAFGAPRVSHSGAEVAAACLQTEQKANPGVRCFCDMAEKLRRTAGGGATTFAVLASAMLREGRKLLAADVNPVPVCRGMDKAAELAGEQLLAHTRPIASVHRISDVAASASGELRIGQMVAEAMQMVSGEGVITVEMSERNRTKLIQTEGAEVLSGFLSPYMTTDPGRTESVLKEPYILLTDVPIRTEKDLEPVLEQIVNTGSGIAVICQEISEEALTFLLHNHRQGILQSVAVKAPEFANQGRELLEDLAVLTGGSVISETAGVHWKEVTSAMLGRAELIRTDKETMRIVGGKGAKEKISERIFLLRKQQAEATEPSLREHRKEQIAKLSGGAVRICVGAPTEAERRERKCRFSDALAAARAAMEEGIIAGGGVAYLRAAECIDKSFRRYSEEEAWGAQIVARALRAPVVRIAANAGYSGEEIAEQIRRSPENIGFDVVNGNYCDMLAAGIADPVKSLRCALESATAIARMLLLTATG